MFISSDSEPLTGLTITTSSSCESSSSSWFTSSGTLESKACLDFFQGAGAAEVPVMMILFEFVVVCLMAVDDHEVGTECWPEAGEVAEAALITFI